MKHSERTRRAVSQAYRIVQSAKGAAMPLNDLARRVALSPFHLQRAFRAQFGLTPKALQQNLRMAALKSELKAKSNVTRAIFDAGFGSGSRAYETAPHGLGMSPARYRAGAKGIGISYAAAKTDIGWIMIAATDRGICSLQIGASKTALIGSLRAEFPAADLSPMHEAQQAVFDEWMQRVREQLAGQRQNLQLPLDVQGTAFQMLVWQCLRAIPYGERRSYAEVARAIGAPRAARAVAGACASNRIALAIPCHRVLRGTGDLSGYRWGIDTKRVLLAREAAAIQRSSIARQAPERQRKFMTAASPII
jgi:AraC family transcriptional regulator, regulatory protein of adaptative response / methylated-DNA-[protein]-cysteine methyltransferase